MVTQQAIADRLGIHRSAVSHVLTGRGEKMGLPPGRIAQIRSTAQQMGYRPNAAARATSGGRMGAVALLLSTDRGRSRLPDGMFDGICDGLAARNLRLTVARLPDEKLTDPTFVPDVLREWAADGMLIDYTDRIPARMIDLIEASGQPVVWINTKRDCDCVRPDDEAIGRLATERLLALGHRRIAWLEYHTREEVAGYHYSRRDRETGYEKAMRAAGLTPHPAYASRPLGMDERAGFVSDLLHGPKRPTALISYAGYSHSLATVTQAMGLRVPDDLSLIGFSDPSTLPTHFGATEREVAYVVMPEREVGQAAVAMLLEKLEGENCPLPPRVIPPAGLYEGAPGRGTLARAGREGGVRREA